MEKELPKGWVETTVDTITASLEIGGRPKGGAGDLSEGIPSISAEHFNFGGQFKFEKLKFIDDAFFRNLKKGVIKSSDVLIVKDGATTGKSAFIDDTFPFPKAAVNEHTFILRTNEKYSPKLFFYFTLSHDFNNHILNTKGGSTIGGIKTGFIKNLKIPLPPLPEQERIVAKLDTLFAHLEQTKKRLEQIPVLLKQFRQAVLTQAVTGKLTEEWREGKELEEVVTKKLKKASRSLLDDKSKDYELFELPMKWEWKTISDVSDVKGGKRLPKGESLVNYNTGLPYIKAGDLKKGTILFDKLEYLLPETQKKIKNYTISKGDVYITNVGACIGDSGIVPNELDGANLTENALKMCNHDGVINKYLAFWLRSPIAQKFIQQSILSAAQGKLALGRVEVFPIPLCSLPEQTEIVRRVESLFAKADALEARYKVLKELVDKLPQAILGKAFRGEV